MKQKCICQLPERFFSSKIKKEHKSECSAGGGFCQWIECKCTVCGREWEENLL